MAGALLHPPGRAEAAGAVPFDASAARSRGGRSGGRGGRHRGPVLVCEQAPSVLCPFVKSKVKNCSRGFRLMIRWSRKESTARETRDIREDLPLTHQGPTDRAWKS